MDQDSQNKHASENANPEQDLVTNLQVLKKEVQKFCEDRDWDKPHNPKDLAIGIITEASELLEIFRFRESTDISNTPENRELRVAIADELADIMCFLLRFSQMYDFDITSCIKNKLKKNAEKYPSSS